MATSESKISCSSLSNKEKENRKFSYIDDFDDTAWDPLEGQSPKSSNQIVSYPFPVDSEDFLDRGYDSGEDQSNSEQQDGPPEVNLRNVLSGVFAILTGRNSNKNHSALSSLPQLPSSNISFLASSKNGETFLNASVYTPSAPPLLEPNAFNYTAYKEVLEAEPPEWLPDSSTTVCMQCNAPFTALTRGRTSLERNPQRVCDTCYDRLDPLQGVLINTISNAAQVAKHDVIDWTCSRGWLNLPVGLSMEHEIYKSANTLRSYCQVARLNPEKSIPAAVLKGARGLAILTVAKAGTILSYKLGTGLVIARRSDGSWSAPSAILSVGLGWGAQIGGELMDFIIVLHDSKAVKTFCSRLHFSLGAGCSAAAGPIGRVVEADLRAGEKGSGMCYTYSCSKGAFVGVSLEGNIVATRMDTNLRFYGDPYLATADILLGTVDRPKAAEPLYAALRDLHCRLQR
ncbi:RING/FYVE/PHD-type zinc finger family protein [Abeliophyllum distichum]|uniref:RING/FYVE/PHD-type zinc finger family protein n=1 Tax=Abeliophyllum distichum TaxID=126358 RepID=A0ABD1VB18_9LAMI